MNHIVQSKLILMNATDGRAVNDEYLNEVTFPFKDILTPSKKIIYSTVSLTSCEIPYSFYNVNINNQVIKYSVGGVSFTMTMPEGNYSAISFAQKFVVLYATGGHGKACLLTINKLNGRLALTPTDNTSTITILGTGTTAQVLLGMVAGTDYTFSFSATPAEFPLPANFLGPKKLKVYSDALSSYNYDSTAMGNNTLVATITSNAAPFGLITHDHNQNQSILKNTTINEIDIRITDEFSNPIDFNSQPWEITFTIHSYMFNDYDPKMKGNLADYVKESRMASENKPEVDETNADDIFKQAEALAKKDEDDPLKDDPDLKILLNQ